MEVVHKISDIEFNLETLREEVKSHEDILSNFYFEDMN